MPRCQLVGARDEGQPEALALGVGELRAELLARGRPRRRRRRPGQRAASGEVVGQAGGVELDDQHRRRRRRGRRAGRAPPSRPAAGRGPARRRRRAAPAWCTGWPGCRSGRRSRRCRCRAGRRGTSRRWCRCSSRGRGRCDRSIRKPLVRDAGGRGHVEQLAQPGDALGRLGVAAEVRVAAGRAPRALLALQSRPAPSTRSACAGGRRPARSTISADDRLAADLGQLVERAQQRHAACRARPSSSSRPLSTRRLLTRMVKRSKPRAAIRSWMTRATSMSAALDGGADGVEVALPELAVAARARCSRRARPGPCGSA